MYSKYFNLIGSHSISNVKYEVYQPYGFPLVLKSPLGRVLASIQVFYDDEDIQTQKCPIPVPFYGGFQVIFQSDELDSKLESGRPIKYILTSHCKEADFIKIDLGFNKIPSSITDPPENINNINEIRPFQSVEIKSNQLDNWKALMIKTKTVVKPDGSKATVSLQEEESAKPEEKKGTYLYLTVTPSKRFGLSELFKDAYWAPEDIIVVEQLNPSPVRVGQVGLIPTIRQVPTRVPRHNNPALIEELFPGAVRVGQVGLIPTIRQVPTHVPKSQILTETNNKKSRFSKLFSCISAPTPIPEKTKELKPTKSFLGLFGSKSETRAHNKQTNNEFDSYTDYVQRKANKNQDYCLEFIPYDDDSFKTKGGIRPGFGARCASRGVSHARVNTLSIPVSCVAYVPPPVAQQVLVETEVRGEIDTLTETQRYIEAIEDESDDEDYYPNQRGGKGTTNFKSVDLDEQHYESSNLDEPKSSSKSKTSEGIEQKAPISTVDTIGSTILESKVAEMVGGSQIIQQQGQTTFVSYDYVVRTEPKKIGLSIMNLNIEKPSQITLSAEETEVKVQEYIKSIQTAKDNLNIEFAKNCKKYRSDTCTVCLDAEVPPSIVLVRCGHMCTCSDECTDILNNKCPICQVPILCRIKESVFASNC